MNHTKTVTYRLAQAARACRARSGIYLAEYDLHAGQDAVLKALDDEDGRSMSELAAALGVQPPTITKMVSRLSAQGYLERRTSSGDGRQANVFLTRQGRSVIASIDRVTKQLEREALADINDKDRRRLRRLLRQMEENLAEAEPRPAAKGSSVRNPMEGL